VIGLWVLVAATSPGLQALTTPSEHGLKIRWQPFRWDRPL